MVVPTSSALGCLHITCSLSAFFPFGWGLGISWGRDMLHQNPLWATWLVCLFLISSYTPHTQQENPWPSRGQILVQSLVLTKSWAKILTFSHELPHVVMLCKPCVAVSCALFHVRMPRFLGLTGSFSYHQFCSCLEAYYVKSRAARFLSPLPLFSQKEVLAIVKQGPLHFSEGPLLAWLNMCIFLDGFLYDSGRWAAGKSSQAWVGFKPSVSMAWLTFYGWLVSC